VACENVAGTERIHEFVENLDGINGLRGGIVEGRTFVDRWLDEEIKQRIKSASA
jgi:hypothetical protein